MDLADGEIMEGWYINGNKKTDLSAFSYQIKKTDADYDNVINVTYKKKNSDKIVLTFAGNIECKKGSLGGDGDITTRSPLEEDDWYRFTPLDLADGEIVEGWYINGNKKTDLSAFSYQIKKADADSGNVINVTYKKKNSDKVVLTFAGNIECKKGYLGYDGDVVTETEVKERDWYRFTAKLNSGEAVKNWLINGKPKSFSNKTEYTYQVKPADFAPDKTMTVSFEKL